MEALSLFDAPLAPPPARSPAPALVAPPRRPRAQSPVRRSRVLLAVDGNALAHRAFHAYGVAGIADSSGRDRGAVYGFFALLAGICDRVGQDALVVGFDDRLRSRRRDSWPGYKANRPEKDPALYALLDILGAVLTDLGVHVIQPEAEEADDVLASAAAAAVAVGGRAVVATSDRDAFGLVGEHVEVLWLRSGLANAVEVTPARLQRDHGIRAGQYLDFAALRGDRSDNLPGVDGIGPSRAAGLLAAYPGVDEAVADPLGCRSVLGPKVGQVLLDDVASSTSVFRRNRALMTLRSDLPVDLAACRRQRSPQQVAAACDEWGLPRLAARLALAVGARPELAAPPA